MGATLRLGEYVRLHNEAVDSGDPRPLAAMFAPGGELAFHGVPVPRACGPAEIEALFRKRRPNDRLVLGPVVEGPPGRAQAVYGWERSPGCVGGTLRLAMAGDRLASLDVVVLRDGPKAPSPRAAVRALLVTPSDRVLLLRCVERATRAMWWMTPGGGVEAGESEAQALRRELAEEVGIDAEPARWSRVWTREHVFAWGQNAVRQRETYFLVPSERAFTPVPEHSPEQLAAEGIGEPSRWWSLEEMRRATDDVFAPRRFPDLLAALLRDGPPAAPVDVGV